MIQQCLYGYDMIWYCIIQYTLDNNRTQHDVWTLVVKPRHRTGVVLFPIGAGDGSLRHDSHDSWIQLNPELHRGLKWSNHLNRFGHFHLVHLLTTSYNFAARLKQRWSTEYTMLTSKSSYCRVFPRNHDSPAHPLLTSTLYIILYINIYIYTLYSVQLMVQCLENANLWEREIYIFRAAGWVRTVRVLACKWYITSHLDCPPQISPRIVFPAGAQQFHVDFVSAVDWWQTQLMLGRLFHYASFAGQTCCKTTI
jgi:hypothetical protein